MSSSKRAKRRRKKSPPVVRRKRKEIADLFDPRLIRARRVAEVEAAFAPTPDRCHDCGVRCDSYFEGDPVRTVCPECCYKRCGHEFEYDRHERCKVCEECGARWSEVCPDDYD